MSLPPLGPNKKEHKIQINNSILTFPKRSALIDQNGNVHLFIYTPPDDNPNSGFVMESRLVQLLPRNNLLTSLARTSAEVLAQAGIEVINGHFYTEEDENTKDSLTDQEILVNVLTTPPMTDLIQVGVNRIINFALDNTLPKSYYAVREVHSTGSPKSYIDGVIKFKE